jgi:hypothetical protein
MKHFSRKRMSALVIGDFGITKRMQTTTADRSEGTIMTIGTMASESCMKCDMAFELCVEDSVPYPEGIDVCSDRILLFLAAKETPRRQ